MIQPIATVEKPLESPGRNAGLRDTGAVANAETARQSGTDMLVVRWTPLYVAAIAAALIAATGVLVLTVL